MLDYADVQSYSSRLKLVVHLLLFNITKQKYTLMKTPIQNTIRFIIVYLYNMGLHTCDCNIGKYSKKNLEVQ